MSASGSVGRDVKRGTWYFVTRVTGPDGKRVQMRRRGFATKKEATAALGLVLADQARGIAVRPSRTTVAAFLTDEWLPAKRAALKPSTAASYEQMIEAYIVPGIGALELGKVDGSTLNALYARLLSTGRTGASGRTGALSPKTVRNVHGLLHKAFKDAIRWRRLSVNPCDAADQPRKQTPEMQVWTPDELRAFIAGTTDDRLGPLWRVFATTGMRRGEVLGLRWSDVDLANRRLTIRQTVTMVGDRPEVGTPKTAAGTRVVSIDDGTVSALKAWKKAQNAERLLMGEGWQGTTTGLVATEPDGTPLHPQTLTRRFHSATKRAGVRCIRLHDVRHSYATAALSAGVPVKVLSQRLGHADIAITLRTYAHVLPGDDATAADIVVTSLGL